MYWEKIIISGKDHHIVLLFYSG